MEWIGLARDRDQWRSVVTTIMSQKTPGRCWVAEELETSREWFTSTELVTFSYMQFVNFVMHFISLHLSHNDV
jgi:hypothetical protein